VLGLDILQSDFALKTMKWFVLRHRVRLECFNWLTSGTVAV